MFDENELNATMCKTCSFCGKDIKLMPAQDISNKLDFCDIICAKLYYDNIERFIFNVKQYNTYYEHGGLTKRAMETFGKARWFMFELMPVYVPNPNEPEYNQPELMIRRYRSILNPTLLKSIGVVDAL